jgi:hypothetical protein
MCHGEEWELMKLAYARELARRKQERAEAERRKALETAAPKPADAPAGNDKIPAAA